VTTVRADIGIGPISIPTPGDVVTALKNAVIDVADAVFDKIIEWIAGLLAQAVSKVTEALVTLLSAIRTTLTPGGRIENAASIQASVAGMAAMLVTIFFVFRIIHGLITGQAGQSLRATIVDLPIVVVGTVFFGFLCYTLLSIVDAFSDPLITDYATTLNETVTRLYSQDGIVQGGVFVIIFALLYIIAAVFLCFELFVRSSLIYLVVMFAPLAIATRVWGPTRSYARRATETAVALIFSKLAIAVTLATGASLMAGAADDGGNVAMIQGSAILLLAAFMPFGLMRVIPMMEGAIAGEGVARTMGAKAAGGGLIAGSALQLAGKGASKVRGSGGQQSGGGTSSNGSDDTGAPADGGTGSGGGGGGPTPPAKPASPTGGGGSTSPILRPGAASSSATGTTTASSASTSPTASPNTAPTTSASARPTDNGSAPSSPTTRPGGVPQTRGNATAPSGAPVDSPTADTTTASTPVSPPSTSKATPTTSTRQPAAGSTANDTELAPSTATAPAPVAPKVIGTPPLKTRAGTPTTGRTPGPVTSPTTSKTNAPSKARTPSRGTTASEPEAPSIPIARSRTIERPKPRTPPAAATASTEKEQP
jgi:type IV secretion system protein TrbL